MSNSKEKAKELVDKFLIYVESDFINSNSEIYNAKQCALIAVDEILKVLCTPHKNEYEYRYWQQVKIEIEKL